MIGFIRIGEKMAESCTCCVCDLKFKEDKVKHIKIRGNVKDICKECVDSIKGLV